MFDLLTMSAENRDVDLAPLHNFTRPEYCMYMSYITDTVFTSHTPKINSE